MSEEARVDGSSVEAGVVGASHIRHGVRELEMTEWGVPRAISFCGVGVARLVGHPPLGTRTRRCLRSVLQGVEGTGQRGLSSMSDYRDIAGWCEWRPEMALYNHPSNVSTVMVNNKPVHYFGALLELGAALAVAALVQDGVL
jgi:hypothetical protein